MKTRLRWLNLLILVALFFGSGLPIAPTLAQEPAAEPAPPAPVAPREGALRFAPPESTPPESPSPPLVQEVNTMDEPGAATETRATVSQSLNACSGPAKIPFGQDLELTMGPLNNYTTTRVDQNPTWGGRTQVSVMGVITTSTTPCPTNPGPDQVLVYKDLYSGSCAILAPGEYTNSGRFGISNDSLTSIKLGSNVAVRLYRDADFSGDTFDTATSIADLRNYNWSGTTTAVNDRTSSIKVWLRPRTYATAAVPLGTDAALAVFKTDSTSGELAVQAWVADRGWLEMARLGLSTAANPVVVSRTPMDYSIFARSGVYIKARHASYRVLDPVWEDVKGVYDAASDPTVVAPNPYYMVLFYRNTAGIIKYTEWESGIGWRDTPISLGKPTNTNLTVDPVAVARDENHIAVFVVVDSKLYIKQWSNANKSDWSDTTWTEVTGLGSVKAAKPAVASLYSTQMSVLVLNTANAIQYKVWTQDTGWAAATTLDGYVEPPGLIATSSEELFLYGVNSSGLFYTRQWTATGGWAAWSAPDGGWTANTPMAAVAPRPHNLMLLGRSSDNYLFYRQYTNSGRAPTATTTSNPTYGVPRGQAIATVNGRTVWVSAWVASGVWNLAARDTATWAGPTMTLDDPVPAASTGNVSLVTADLDRDGNDEVILGTLNDTGTYARLSIYRITHSGTAVTAITRSGYRAFTASSGLRDVQVAVGDVDGDGSRDELVIAVHWKSYANVVVRLYKGTSLTLLTSPNIWIGTALDQDFEMAIGQLDGQKGDQIVLATWGGTYPFYKASIKTLRYDSNTATFSTVLEESSTVIAQNIASQYSSALATGDIDGDGLDEVIHARGIEIVAKDMGQSGAELKQIAAEAPYKSLAVGDVDGDGRAEIVFGRSIQTSVFKQMDVSSVSLSTVVNSPTPGVPLLADLDADSYVATFRSCHEFSDVHVLGVVNSFPVWYQNGQPAQYTGGGMANSTTATTGEADGWKASFGGSITIGFKKDITIIFTKFGEWRTSVTQEFMGSFGGGSEREESTSESDGYEYGSNNFALGGVCYAKTSYKCYVYDIAKPGTSVTTSAMSCVPVVGTGMPQQWCSTLDNWYSAAFRAEAGSSWAPIGHHPPNTTTLSVDLGWPNNYPVLTAPPVDPYRVWWQKSSSVGVQGDVNPGSPSTWSVEKSTSTKDIKKGSFDSNTTISAGAEILGFSVDASFKTGYGTEWSNSVAWEEGVEFTGNIFAYPTSCAGNPCKSYAVVPYVYKAQAVTNAGVRYNYLEQDYYVSWMSPTAQEDASEAGTAEPRAIMGVTPQAPIITSATHPDPDTWVSTNTLVLNWEQPAGDPAVVTGYRWNLNQTPVATPTSALYMTTTHTYEGLPDGVLYLHLQAMGDGGDLGPVAHRAVRVDMNAPQVMLVPDPFTPDGFNDWYNTPVTVAVTATDTIGSGIASVETSTDGATWLPYSAPIPIAADTPGATLWARATDAMGYTSEPVSTTIKLDQAAPSTYDSDGYGLSYASIITDEVGNAQLVLGGALSDALSGRLQVEVKAGDTGAWNPVSAVGDLPMPPGNTFTTTMTSLQWIYTPTFELRGVYPLWARGVDAAGNYEDAWIHGVFWWEPDETPTLLESQLSVSPHRVYPGDEVAFSVGARNTGYQEAQLRITNTVPSGLTIIPDSISDGGEYNATTRVITWTLHALWPGQTRYLFYKATADNTAITTTLDSQVDFMAYWPWLALPGVPAEPARHTYSTTTTLTVLPATGRSVATAPRLLDAGVLEGAVVNDRQVTVVVNATPDTQYLYVKEWVWDVALDAWTLAQESGWTPFQNQTGLEVSEDGGGKYGRYTWALSEGDGVKYLGVWVADANGQVSNLNEGNLIATNLFGTGAQLLAAGQRVQYRVPMRAGDLGLFNLVTLSGDADLYIWKPRFAFRPHYFSNGVPGASFLDAVGFFAEEENVVIVEVEAATDGTSYRLVASGDLVTAQAVTVDGEEAAAAREIPHSTWLTLAEKERPAHPLTLSSPFSLNNAAMLPAAPNQTPEIEFEFYLPLVFKTS